MKFIIKAITPHSIEGIICGRAFGADIARNKLGECRIKQAWFNDLGIDSTDDEARLYLDETTKEDIEQTCTSLLEKMWEEDTKVRDKSSDLWKDE